MLNVNTSAGHRPDRLARRLREMTSSPERITAALGKMMNVVLPRVK
jgi:hypothetical protein